MGPVVTQNGRPHYLCIRGIQEECMGQITVVTGGARSGKSSYAEELVGSCGEKIAYIATALALDPEMEERIEKHQLQRPGSWQTFEESYSPATMLSNHGAEFDAVLLDCLTVLTSNIILEQDVDWESFSRQRLAEVEAHVMTEIKAIVTAAGKLPGHLVAVTNEVGFGIVPNNPLSRFFRDCAGRVNQLMATEADVVYLVVSGIPMKIKG